jgi:hypothetical protein
MSSDSNRGVWFLSLTLDIANDHEAMQDPEGSGRMLLPVAASLLCTLQQLHRACRTTAANPLYIEVQQHDGDSFVDDLVIRRSLQFKSCAKRGFRISQWRRP